MQTKFPQKYLPYLLLAPSLLVVLIFLIIPSVQSLYLSFFRVSPFGDRLFFVGLANFQNLFTSADYVSSLLLTLLFTAAVTVLGLTVSLAIAMLVNQRIPGISFYRTALIWPYALSPAIAGTIWALLFDPATGAMSYFISQFTGEMPNWRTNGQLALTVVTIAAAWKMLGYNVIFFLAGLQNIHGEILDAARIDGARAFKRFWHVIRPLLSPTTFFLFIMNSLYGFFEVFGLIDVMTQGGPGNATEVLVYKLYREGFVNLRTGYASAQSIVLFVFVAVLTLLQFRFARSRVFYR